MLLGLISCGGASFTSQNSQKATSASSENVEQEEVEPFGPPEQPVVVEEPPPVEEEEEEILPPEPLNESLMLSCESSDKVHSISAQIDQEITLSFAGEVCPTPLAQDPRILFIVDVSGSMGDRQNTFGGIPTGPIIPGADTFENGTCGRYEAIKAILAETKASAATQTGRAGIILFGSSIHPNSVEFTNLEDFEARVTPENICLAVDGTNYQQAFLTAKEWLDAEEGTLKVAYFISDGEPTEINGNLAPPLEVLKSTSIEAGKSLTQAGLEGTSTKLFQVFLGVASPESLEVMEGIAGEDNLDSIKEVEKASDLAKVLTDFSIVDLDITNLTITADLTPIELTSFEEVEKGANAKWSWSVDDLTIPSDVNELTLKLELTHDNIETVTVITNVEVTRD